MADTTIKEVLTMVPNEPCKRNVHVNVINKGKTSEYKDGKMVVEVVVADQTEAVRMLVYDQQLSLMCQEGEGLILGDFIVKTGFIVATRITEMFASSKLALPQEVIERAANIVGHIMTVAETTTSPKKTKVKSVEGVVVKASPTEIKRRRTTNEELPFKRARLRDESGTVEVCLWRQLAKTDLKKGDVVRFTEFEVTECLDSRMQPTAAICNKHMSSAIEILPATAKYDDLIDLPEDLLEDDPHQSPPVTIIGFGPINVYASCPNEACYRKKVVDLKCCKCNVRFGEESVQKSVNGSLKVSGQPTMHYFTQHAEALKEQLSITVPITDSNFVHHLVKHLPMTALLSSKDNKVVSIKVIK